MVRGRREFNTFTIEHFSYAYERGQSLNSDVFFSFLIGKEC